jgi:hypothetical protein
MAEQTNQERSGAGVSLTSDERVIHFGPVYGRPVGTSMSLCDSTLPPHGSSRTMSRSLKMITCSNCEQSIQDLVNLSCQRSVA